MEIFINTISLIGFLFFTIAYIKRFRFYFLLLFPVFFSQLWVIASSYYLDFGNIYSFELDMTSQRSYATTFLILGNILFFSIIKLNLKRLNFFEFVEIEQKKPLIGFNRLSWDLVLGVIILCNTIIVIDMLVTGIPILSGVNRASYADEVLKRPIVSQVYKYYLVVCFFTGFSFVNSLESKWRKKLSISQIIAAYGITLLQGNKFSAFLDITLIMCISPVIHGLFNAIKKRTILITAAIISVLVLVVMYIQSISYEYIGELSSGSLTGYIAERFFILQGEIWWKSFNLTVTENQFSFAHLHDEIANIFSSTTSYTGLKYLMEYTSSGPYIYKLLETEEGQFLFTGGSPAIFLVSFGPFFYWIVIALIAYVFSWLIFFLKKIVLTGQVLILFFLITFFQSFSGFFISGNFDAFFILGNLFRFFIIGCFLIYIFLQNNFTKKNAKAVSH